MSQENVELLRKAFSAYNSAFQSKDPSKLFPFADPDVEWYAATEIFERVYRGHEESNL